MKSYHLSLGHLVVDLCCYGNVSFFKVFYIETMLLDDFSSLLEDVWSKISIRRYVLPLELDKKVDSTCYLQFIPLNWRHKRFYNLCMQLEGENLVTLEDTSASAVLQKDGTVVCTHELLSPIGLLSQ